MSLPLTGLGNERSDEYDVCCVVADAADRPKLVCEQLLYEANLHGTDVTLQCLVRSHPVINASQAVYSWTTLSGRNESITAGQRDGHYFAHLRPGVCFNFFSV